MSSHGVINANEELQHFLLYDRPVSKQPIFYLAIRKQDLPLLMLKPFN
jgi:hypothetical protein